MKNFGKILAFVVVLSMLFTLVAFGEDTAPTPTPAATETPVATAAPATNGSFSDVKDTDSAYQAITTLCGLGVITGYPDGTFGPDKSITRAEFSAVVDRVKALGDSADAAKGATMFTDVTGEHWASGYINLASQQGIVNGMGDGTFAPDANVTFAQAVKMVVVALGYEPQAQSSGGWPSGYLAVAAQKGVTKGVASSKESEPATRATVVKMLYNALDIPMMEQTGFGTDVAFEAGDKLLLDGLDVIKVEGIVDATRYSAGSAAVKNDQVKFTAQYQYVAVKGVLKKLTPGSDTDISDSEDIYVGKTNAKDLLDFTVEAYIKNIDDNPEFIAVTPKSGKNETVTVKSSDIKYSDFVTDTKGNIDFVYYTDKDNSKDDTVTIDGNTASTSSNQAAKYYYNSTTQNNKRPIGFEGTTKQIFDNAVTNKNFEGTIILLNNDTDDYYDVVYMTEYKDYIVDDVNAKTYKVMDETSAASSSIVFDMENKDYDISFIKDGKAAKFEDIKEGNVISVAGIMNGSSNELEYGKVIITDANIEGKVVELNTDDTEVKIGDKTYEYTAAVPTSKIEAGDEGKFYINADGKIIAVDTVSDPTKSKLFYVTKIAQSTGISSTYQARALLTSGEWKTFDIADKVNANEDGVKNSDTEVIWGKVTGVAPSAINNDAGTWNVYKMASYDVDSNGKVNKIDFAPDGVSARDDSNFFVKDLSIIDTYSETSKKISSGIFVNDKTVLFNIGIDDKGTPSTTDDTITTEEDEITVVNVDSLIDGTNYNNDSRFTDAKAYNLNDDDEAAVIVGYKFAGVINFANNFMVVDTKSSTLNSDSTEVAKLTGYVGSDKVELTVKDTVDTDAIFKGTVLAFTKDVKGEINKIEILYQANTVAGDNQVANPVTEPVATPVAPATSVGIKLFDRTAGSNDKFDYVLGYAYDKSSTRYTFTFDDTPAVKSATDKTLVNTETYSFASGATIVEYDEYYSTSGRVRVVDSSYIETDKDSTDGVKGDYVFAKVDDSGRIVDAVIIKHKG